MLEHRKCYDFPISNRSNDKNNSGIDAQTEELQLKALEDIRTSLKAESPSNRESLGRLIFRIEQEMQKYEPLIRPTPSWCNFILVIIIDRAYRWTVNSSFRHHWHSVIWLWPRILSLVSDCSGLTWKYFWDRQHVLNQCHPCQNS